MNKALFGILAAALVASAKQVGSRNKSKVSSIKDFFVDMANDNVRPDVFMAVAYSFIDFKEEDYTLALSKITNMGGEFSLEEQALMFYRLKSSKEMVESLALSIESAIIESFSSTEEALNVFSENAFKLKDAYNQYFRINDFGLAYLYLQEGVLPKVLNEVDWLTFFKGSKKSQSFANFSTLNNMEELSKMRDVYLSAIIRSDLSYRTSENGRVSMFLGDYFGVDHIFKSVKSIFEAIVNTEKTKDLPIERYYPEQIFVLLDSNAKAKTLKNYESYDDLLMISLFLDAIVWVKNKLIELGAQDISETTTFEQMYQFWELPERGPTHTMVSVQMDLYRGNVLTEVVPQEYKKKGGVIEESWALRGTAAWSVGSWIVYHIYKVLKENPAPSLRKWSFGIEISQRIFDSISKGLISNINSGGQAKVFIEKVYNSYVGVGTSDIIYEISNGSSDIATDIDLSYIGFNTDNDLDKSLLGQEILTNTDVSEDNIIEVYKGDARALNYMGAFLGHCRTVSIENPTIYSVFYMGVPYYTVEVNSQGKMTQFKGFQNRGLGLMPRVDTKNLTKQKENKARASNLFLDDVRNFKLIYSIIKEDNPSLSLSDIVLKTDLVLLQQGDMQKVSLQSGLSYTISSMLS
jgi:hypothetical protein